MPSTLSWIDHDPKERDRMNQILSLFRESETRDELGIGPIRDSFADLLFPGTSTIQTRLRYMLFIPWIYKMLEERQVASSEISRRARNLEISLIEPLEKDGDIEGVIGREARAELKRLPSSVYWSGLRSWGIRYFSDSLDQYHQGLDGLYRLRKQQKHASEEERIKKSLDTWHPKLPPAPPDFPDKVSFRLTKNEAEFLKDRLVFSHRGSLLSYLADKHGTADVDFPWDHPNRTSFRKEHQLILEHGKLFSEVMHGAAILYNFMLAELKSDPVQPEDYAERMRKWQSTLNLKEVRAWSLTELWRIVTGQGHTISPQLKSFVREWVSLVGSTNGRIEDNRDARKLVANRERRLKGARSRFKSPRALDQWTGKAGLNRLDYRWYRAKVFLTDLYRGLRRR